MGAGTGTGSRAGMQGVVRFRILHVDLRGAGTAGSRPGAGSRLAAQLLAGADEGRLGALGKMRLLLLLLLVLLMHLLVFAQHRD